MNADGGYLWLVYGWNGPEWWTLSVSDSKGYEAFNCSREQVESMVQESIALDHYIYVKPDNESMTDIGIVRQYYYMYVECFNCISSHLHNMLCCIIRLFKTTILTRFQTRLYTMDTNHYLLMHCGPQPWHLMQQKVRSNQWIYLLLKYFTS